MANNTHSEIAPFYTTTDFRDLKYYQMFGNNFSKKNQRKFKRYLNSNQGRSDWYLHEKAEGKKYLESFENRINSSHDRFNLMLEELIKASILEETQKPTSKSANMSTEQQLVSKQVKKADEDWLAIAKQFGFTSLEDVKNWLTANGLIADGKFGKISQAKYKEIAENNQKIAQQIHKTTSNNIAQPQTITIGNTSSGITELDFRNNKHFRNIHGGIPNATIVIEGKTYPMMVTTGLLGSNSGIENDRIYAFDPETGMVRAVWENFMGMPHNQWADNSTWIIPNWMVGPEYEWKKANPMPAMRGPLGGGLTPEYKAWVEKYKAAKAAGFKKQGGTMNRIKYFQQGGSAPQQDIQQQVIKLVQAAMGGDEKATQTVNQIIEAAKAGDQQAVQIAQMILEVVKQMLGQATAAKWGAKLGYIRSLKFANGGKTCPTCQQGATIKKEKTFTKPNKKVEEKACGGKTKKRYFGGWL